MSTQLEFFDVHELVDLKPEVERVNAKRPLIQPEVFRNFHNKQSLKKTRKGKFELEVHFLYIRRNMEKTTGHPDTNYSISLDMTSMSHRCHDL